MKEIKEYEKDLASIRTMMERSAKFISLSGLSGVLAGIYALLGATAAYYIAQYPVSPLDYRTYTLRDEGVIIKLLVVAGVVFVASITTGVLQSMRKAKKHNVKFWNTASKQMVFNLSIPLVAGALFILIMLANGHYGLAAPASLVFYGLALIQGSSNTFDEVRYLGYCEIVIGLVCAYFAGYGLLFWALGFGVMHIVYGSIMYNKYDR
ncbi:MAG TPA: hypothetical protein VGD40_06715 [Chryseosolibacter sp.]